MSTPDQTEPSLRGLGAGLMLPAQGNPFAKEPPPPDAELLPVGAERGVSQEALPPTAPGEGVATLPEFPVTASAAAEALAASIPTEVSMPEPRDLTPEDLLALFPSTHAEREAAPVDVSPAPAPAEPLPAVIVPAELVTTSALETAPVPAAPISATLPVAASSAEVIPVAAPEVPAAPPPMKMIPAEAPAVPMVPAALSPGEVVVVPPAEAAAPAEPSAPSAPVPAGPSAPPTAAPGLQLQRGMRLLGPAAPSGAVPMTLGLAKDDLQAAPFTPSVSLPASASLTAMFVPDSRLMTLWLDIDSVEADVTATKRMSQSLARELLDRLMQARNVLMNERSQYEEAARQVAEVKYHLTNFRSASSFTEPFVISAYLAGFFVLVMAGVFLGQSLAWDRLQIFNTKLDMLWYTMLVGGIGGFTGAVYSLVQHVARDRDYDPQFALWYYQNPWMGLVLGIFVYIAVYIVMNMGSLVVNQQTTSGSLISAFITLFFGWIVGFKHNIAFDLADMALKKLIPGEPDSNDSGSGNAKPPAPTANQ